MKDYIEKRMKKSPAFDLLRDNVCGGFASGASKAAGIMPGETPYPGLIQKYLDALSMDHPEVAKGVLPKGSSVPQGFKHFYKK